MVSDLLVYEDEIRSVEGPKTEQTHGIRRPAFEWSLLLVAFAG
jgi:hypothetical protein